MDYPVGDARNSIVFRLVLFIALAVLGIIASARWLLADRRRGRVNAITDSATDTRTD